MERRGNGDREEEDGEKKEGRSDGFVRRPILFIYAFYTSVIVGNS